LYHSTLGLGVIKKKKKKVVSCAPEQSDSGGRLSQPRNQSGSRERSLVDAGERERERERGLPPARRWPTGDLTKVKWGGWQGSHAQVDTFPGPKTSKRQTQ